MPLPPYTYVPGRTPHPIRDPAGHMYGKHEQSAELDIENWQRCDQYLFGIDLFNHGYYWEAHEAWESLWHAAGRTGAIADFLKGLIKLAAAGVKTREGSAAGRERHARRAVELFQCVLESKEQNDRLMGLSLSELSENTTRVAEAPLLASGDASGSDLEIRLLPKEL